MKMESCEQLKTLEEEDSAEIAGLEKASAAF